MLISGGYPTQLVAPASKYVTYHAARLGFATGFLSLQDFNQRDK
jgi:hypothetical protein